MLRCRCHSLRLALIAAAVVHLAAGIGRPERLRGQQETASEQPKPKEQQSATIDPRLARVAAKAEPTGNPDVRRLATYLSVYRSELANDPRLFLFDVAACPVDGGGVRLSGYVEFSQTHHGVVAFFKALGFAHVDDQIDELPDPSLGERRYGVVTAPHLLSYDAPQGRRSVVTDCLFGEPLILLRRTENGHWLCHSAEGYLGYVDGKNVRQFDRRGFLKYLRQARHQVTSDFRSGGRIVLPAGSRVRVLARKRVDGGDLATIQAMDRVVTLGTSDVRTLDGPEEGKLDRIAQTARSFIGTPYLWGGKTHRGIDCSGLVQVSFASAGFKLPRDSNQQIYLGRLTGTRWFRDAMSPGDTMYFLGPFGRIRHTAIYLGNDRFIEATTPVVRVASLNPKDADYDERRVKTFAFAKRLWDSGP